MATTVRRGVVKGRRRKARAAIDEQLTLIWNEAREQIRGRVNDATFRLWFEEPALESKYWT